MYIWRAYSSSVNNPLASHRARFDHLLFLMSDQPTNQPTKKNITGGRKIFLLYCFAAAAAAMRLRDLCARLIPHNNKISCVCDDDDESRGSFAFLCEDMRRRRRRAIILCSNQFENVLNFISKCVRPLKS